MARRMWTGLLCAGLVLGTVGCGSSTEVTPTGEATSRGAEWVEASHGKVDPDTAKAFPDTVRTLTLEVPASAWAAIVSNLTLRCGAFGSLNATCSGGTFDSVDASSWFAGSLGADGQQWLHVGMKLRGNSDLAGAWEKGSRALPFKITMDRYEDSFATIKNQRFYGYQKLSLTPLGSDSSALREQVASELFRRAGVPAPFSGVVRLRLVLGGEAVDAGLYSLSEMLDGPLLKRSFGESTGNLYEPTSDFATFKPSDFEGDDNDATYSDVQLLYYALHDPSRITAPASWRAALGARLNVPGFLTWLAVNTALRNTDSYGSDAKGYFLYAKGGVLQWGGEGFVKTFKPATVLNASVWHPNAGESWPMISYLLKDSTTCEQYRSTMKALVAGPLSAANVQAHIARHASSVSASQPSTATGIAALSAMWSERLAQIDTSLAAHACP